MARLKLVLFFLVAILAVEPILHNHSLIPGGADSGVASSSNVCAICAVGVDRIAAVAPSIAAPQVVAFLVAAVAATRLSDATPLILASRAPPLA